MDFKKIVCSLSTAAIMLGAGAYPAERISASAMTAASYSTSERKYGKSTEYCDTYGMNQSSIISQIDKQVGKGHNVLCGVYQWSDFYQFSAIHPRPL